jgi:putative restriction endonuclease
MASYGRLEEQAARLRVFQFLEEQTARHGEVLDWSVLTKDLIVNGRVIPLIGASGIWKPEVLSIPISVTTKPPQAGKAAPYDDGVGSDGLLRYRYQGDDPNNHFNTGMRQAFRQRLPLVYFLGIEKGRYRPFWPAFIVRDDPEALTVYIELHDAATTGIDLADIHSTAGEPTLDRVYARRLTLQRLHQAAFRERVMRAYRHTCAVCRLKHRELLDAAHIIGDREALGAPEVSNGLALCKIHHAAFDSHILGIRPDYVVEIRTDVLDEVDGPMLRFGLQATHGQPLIVPSRKADRPSTDLLERRYARFRQAS